jgi:hypothetical protein
MSRYGAATRLRGKADLFVTTTFSDRVGKDPRMKFEELFI